MNKTKNKRIGVAATVAAALTVATLVACGGGGRGSGSLPAGSTIDGPGGDSAAGGGVVGSCGMFPPQAVFNTRIDDTSRFPAHPNSNAWIAMVGSSTPFRADWWRFDDPTRLDTYFGMPINVVDGSVATTDWAQVQYDFGPSGANGNVGWPHESDCAVPDGAGGYTLKRNCSVVAPSQRLFPFPRAGVKNQGGECHDPNACGDHHVAVVETGACRLWEGYATYPVNGSWYTLSTAAWDLNSLDLRPSGWTAADAAGLPITPFVARAAEAEAGEIRHALRVTFRDAVLARSFDWPARHFAGDDTPGGIPFGAVLRLKADFAIPEGWSPHAKAIATAAKRYGLYVGDIGMDFYVAGEPSTGWNAQLFGELSSIPLSQMEFVDLRAITGDPRFSNDSMAARW